jgi:hypothetical protein
MVPQYVLGPDYLGVDGNNERAFPLMLALLVLGVVGMALAWRAIDLDRLPASPRRERLVGRVLLPIAAVAVYVRYAAALPGMMGAGRVAEDYLAGPTFAWTIALLDLGLALPAIVTAWVGARLGAPGARPALYAVVGWLALVGIAVAGMAVAMMLRHDPAMSGAAMAVMVALAAGLSTMAALLYGPLLRRRRSG